MTEQMVGKKGTPVKPKFLNGERVMEPQLPKGFKEPRNFPNNTSPAKPKFSREDAFAAWCTMPFPRNCDHTRLTAARAKYEFFAETA